MSAPVERLERGLLHGHARQVDQVVTKLVDDRWCGPVMVGGKDDLGMRAAAVIDGDDPAVVRRVRIRARTEKLAEGCAQRHEEPTGRTLLRAPHAPVVCGDRDPSNTSGRPSRRARSPTARACGRRSGPLPRDQRRRRSTRAHRRRRSRRARHRRRAGPPARAVRRHEMRGADLPRRDHLAAGGHAMAPILGPATRRGRAAVRSRSPSPPWRVTRGRLSPPTASPRTPGQGTRTDV